MAKAVKEGKDKDSWRVNIEIAPGNLSRLQSYIKEFNKNPERRSTSLTLADVLNEALDWFFSTTPYLLIETNKLDGFKTKKRHRSTGKSD